VILCESDLLGAEDLWSGPGNDRRAGDQPVARRDEKNYICGSEGNERQPVQGKPAPRIDRKTLYLKLKNTVSRHDTSCRVTRHPLLTCDNRCATLIKERAKRMNFCLEAEAPAAFLQRASTAGKKSVLVQNL